MSVERVVDISLQEIAGRQYDLAIFSSGYEERATHAASRVAAMGARFRKCSVLGFREFEGLPQRVANDAYFLKTFDIKVDTLSGRDEGPLYELLLRDVALDRRPRLLVDYSSMSKLWYAGILNWARFGTRGFGADIDFLYSESDADAEDSTLVIDDMFSLPGFEGGAVGHGASVAVFGLGFNGIAALCVLDRLEADYVYSYLASPTLRAEYPEKVRRLNKALIEDGKMRSVLEIPLRSVEMVYRVLSDLVLGHSSDGDITLVPMGPKPHALGAMLVGLRFPSVSCLRISTRGREDRKAPSGGIVATSVCIVGTT